MLQRQADSTRRTGKRGERISAADGDGRKEEEAARICRGASSQGQG